MNNAHALLFSLLFLIRPIGHTQTIEWQKNLGGSEDEVATAIAQTSDGYIVAGYTESNDHDVSGHHGDNDYWVVKLNAAGNIQWQKCLGGSADDIAYAIIQTSDGGYVVAGSTGSNNGDVSGNHGTYDYWVVKLSATGNMQWQKCLGGSSSDHAYSLARTADGGYVVAGASMSNDGDVSGNHGDYDDWVVKLDATGTIQWQKSLGGDEEDIAYSIVQTNDGSYLVAGLSHSDNGDVITNHGGDDYWVVKLNSSGDVQWQKSLGGSGYEEAHAVVQASDGGYIVAGYTESKDGDVTGNHSGPYGTTYDEWVVKLDAGGAIQWQKCLGGRDDEEANAMARTANGGYIIAGASESDDGDATANYGNGDFWIVKLAGNGTFVENGHHEETVSIYPNPTKGKIHIQLAPAPRKTYDIAFINSTGQTIFNIRSQSDVIEIDRDRWPSGVYTIKITTEGSVYTRKLLLK